MKTNHYLLLLSFLYLGIQDTAFAQSGFKKHPVLQKLLEKGRRTYPNLQSARMASTTPLPRSINYNWDIAMANWQASDTTDYLYNAQGKVLEEVTFNGFSNLRTTYQYDAQGRVIEEATYSPTSTGWQLALKTNTVYNADGEVELLLELSYTAGQLSDTSFASRMLTTMNPLVNKPAKKTIQNYNTITDTWENESEIVLEYNSSGSVLRSVEANWGLNKWDTIAQVVNNWSSVNNRISSFILSLYDTASGHVPYIRLNSIIYHTWNGSFENSLPSYYVTSVYFNNNWVPTQRTRTTYDANGGFVQIDSTAFFTPVFEPDVKYSYIVNNQGDFEGEKTEIWQNNAWQLESHDELQYTYNTQGQIEEIISRYYDAQLAAYINETRKDFVPGIVQGLEPISGIAEVKIEAYPNPVETNTQIRLSVADKETFKIMLLDMTGRMVQQISIATLEPGTHEISIPMSELPTGHYLLRVQGSKRSFHHRLVKN